MSETTTKKKGQRLQVAGLLVARGRTMLYSLQSNLARRHEAKTNKLPNGMKNRKTKEKKTKIRAGKRANSQHGVRTAARSVDTR